MTTARHSAPFTYETFQKTAPSAVAALAALGKAIDDSGLEKELTELVKLRVSQINGCAFCTQLHLNVARKIGVAASKLDLLAVWRDAGLFSVRERAALAWAEYLARMDAKPIPQDAYAELCTVFSDAETTHLTVAIGQISAWNRIAGALRFAPPVPKGGS